MYGEGAFEKDKAYSIGWGNCEYWSYYWEQNTDSDKRKVQRKYDYDDCA